MRILKPGKGDQKADMGKCDQCGCEFEFMPKDLTPQTWHYSEKVRCPWCGNAQEPYRFIHRYDIK